ncbi:MAG: Queuine tRNA-ribosyltransferase, partial [Candidatus Yanofskybacteria bacterium GW2011_GWD2_39_48]
MFEIIKKDKRTKARLGVLTTPHGVVNTPSYVFVGTY